MTYQTSEARLNLEGFNNMPPRDAVTTLLETLLEKDISYVDVDEKVREYWKNDSSTLVIKIENAKKAVVAMQALFTLHPDELNYFIENDAYIIRVWWD